MADSFIHSFFQSFTRFFNHSLTHSLIYHSFTHFSFLFLGGRNIWRSCNCFSFFFALCPAWTHYMWIATSRGGCITLFSSTRCLWSSSSSTSTFTPTSKVGSSTILVLLVVHTFLWFWRMQKCVDKARKPGFKIHWTLKTIKANGVRFSKTLKTLLVSKTKTKLSFTLFMLRKVCETAYIS